MSAAHSGAFEVTGVKLCPRCGTRYDAAAVYCQQDGAMLEGPEETVDPYVGTTILDQLQVLEIIGTGGMGTVYRARQLGVERDVAVKILHRELVHNDEAMRRFQREARVASSLEHPNVVSVYMFGQLPDGNLYMAMELMRGQTLLEAMQLAHRESPTGGMDPARALHVALQICDAVGEAHRRAIVHRDIKPENVFLVHRGKDADFVKVLDFGIARFWMGSETVATKTGLVFGTAKYISPEGASGEHTDARSDVYSIGVLLYHMLAGEAPFDSPSPVALLMKHIHEAAPPLLSRAGATHVPNALADVVMRCLAKNASARYDDAAQLGEALREAAAAAGLLVEVAGRASFAGFAPPWSRSSHPPAAAPALAVAVLGDAPTDPGGAAAAPAAVGIEPPAASADPSERPSERPSLAPVRPSVAVGGMHIVDNEPMEIESPPRARALAARPGPSSRPPAAERTSGPPTTRERPDAAAAAPAGGPTAAVPPRPAPASRSSTASGSSTAMAWDQDEDDVAPPASRRRWLPWILAAAFFAVGVAAVAAVAWSTGLLGPRPGASARPGPRLDLVAIEARARAALDHGAFDTPAGENVLALTDTILAARPAHAGALAIRARAADQLERSAQDALRQGRADEALAMVGRALVLVPDHEASRRLLAELRSSPGALPATTRSPPPIAASPRRSTPAVAAEPAAGAGRRPPRRASRARGSGTPDLGRLFPDEPAPEPPPPSPPEAPAGNPGDAVDWSIPEEPAPPAPAPTPAPETTPPTPPAPPTTQPPTASPPPTGNDLAPATPAPWVGGTSW